MRIIDPGIIDLIPHREPLLLIHELIEVSASRSEALVHIDASSPFFVPGDGVPSIIGVEYMGQAAALIAGYQQQHGSLEPHLGFLLGVRAYQVAQASFPAGSTLRVTCEETAVVGTGLAKFDCEISDTDSGRALGTGKISVFRKPLG